MKAIVSVFAKDTKGIIAYVTTLLADKGVNVLDISQTLMQEYFAMIMLVDLSACDLAFPELKETLVKTGESIGMQVNIQHTDIFDYMHRI